MIGKFILRTIVLKTVCISVLAVVMFFFGDAMLSTHAKIFERLSLENSYDINEKDEDGKTELIRACECCDLDDIKRIISQDRVDVNVKGDYQITALMYACDWGDEEIVSLLLSKKGIDVNMEDVEGNTAFYHACMNGNFANIKNILSQEGVSVNTTGRIGYTALMWACIKGNEQAVSLFLEYPEININAQKREGETALMLACWEGHEKVVEILLKHQGIDVNMSSFKGSTALSIAATKDNPSIFFMLMSHQKICPCTFHRALEVAVVYGRITVIDELLKKCEVVDTNKLLYDAIFWAEPDVIKFLVGKFSVENFCCSNQYGFLLSELGAVSPNVNKKTLMFIKEREDVEQVKSKNSLKSQFIQAIIQDDLTRLKDILRSSVFAIRELCEVATDPICEGLLNPLAVSAKLGSVQCFRYFLLNKADFNSKYNVNTIYGVKERMPECFDALYRIKSSCCCMKGISVFAFAFMGGNLEIIQLLGEQIENDFSNVPEDLILYAAKADKFEENCADPETLVEWLLDQGVI